MPFNEGQWVDPYPRGSAEEKAANEHAGSIFRAWYMQDRDPAFEPTPLPDDAWDLAKRDMSILPEDRVARDRQLLDANPLLLHQTSHGNASGIGPRGQ